MIIYWPKKHKAPATVVLATFALSAAMTLAAMTWVHAQQSNAPALQPSQPPASTGTNEPGKSEAGKNEAGKSESGKNDAGKSGAGKNETPAVVLNDEDLSSILSQPVFSAAGETMGHIVDVLVDRKADIRAVIIDFGGFLGVGTRKVAVDWHALHFPAKGKLDRMILSLSRNEVQLAPEYKPGEPIVVLGGSPNAAPAAATPTPATSSK